MLRMKSLSKWTATVLLAMSCTSVHALIFEARVQLRKTALCAELMTTVRAANSAMDSSELRKELTKFQFEGLNSRPVADALAQPAIQADSSSSAEKKNQLAARVYGIERSFQMASEDSSVVGYAVVEGDAGIESFTNRLEAAREQILKDAQSDYRHIPFSREGMGRHFLQVGEYSDSPILAYVAGKFGLTSLIMGSVSLHALYNADLKMAGIAAGFVAMSAVTGMLDYPIRHIRSYETGHKKLVKWIKNFGSSQESWSYWSRDLKLSKQFLEELMGSPILSWRTMDQENLRENIPGAFRLLQQRRLPQEIRGDAQFSIDALLKRDEAGTSKLILVLRSRPFMKSEPQTKSAANPLGLPQTQTGR